MPHVEHAAAMRPGPTPMVPKCSRSRIGIATEDDDRLPGREHRVAERRWEDGGRLLDAAWYMKTFTFSGMVCAPSDFG